VSVSIQKGDLLKLAHPLDEIKATGLPERVRSATVEPGTIALWHLGGAGYAVKTAGALLIVDPFLGPSGPPEWVRGVAPPFAPDEIPAFGAIDALLITHEHRDHADPVALQAFMNRTAVPVYGPGSAIDEARGVGYGDDRLHQVRHGETVTFGDLRVTAVAVNDPTARECNGYVLETGETILLLAGDSHYFDGFAALGEQFRPDAIALTVGLNPPGASIYMSESDAARIARDTGTRLLIHQHHDLWQRLKLDPQRVAAVTAWYAPNTRVVGTVVGERLDVTTERSKA
jgi:L-ascorbate metabolism protein UlaG (beta-lactamase superfamily)